MKVILSLFLVLFSCAYVQGLNGIPQPHKEQSNVLPKVDEVPSADNMTFRCAMCGILMNEIEGLLIEDMTIEDIEAKLLVFCDDLWEVLQGECKSFVYDLPAVIERIENVNSVSTICVDDGYCPVPFTPLSDPQPVKTYVIDLDELPDKRWKAVCTNPVYRENLQIIVSGFEALFGKTSREMNILGKTINTLYFPVEYGLEIRACAEDLGVDFGWLTILNMIYEVVGACTSIVSQTTDGKILHVRNMDFWDGIWLTEHLKNVTFTAEFHSLGKLKYYSTSFAGYVGVLSGMRPKGFSISVDTRRYGLADLKGYLHRLIEDITHRNASLTTFLTRETITDIEKFEPAVQKLSDSPIPGNVYYIVGGIAAGEGAVITRNPYNATDVWRLDAKNGRWYEVETNYDHWKEAPWFDDRIVPANRAMDSLGQKNISLDALLKQVLSVKPVLNLQSTFSMLASAFDSTYTSVTRYCPYPCAE